jgi:uncharacterized membrane protein YbjE (DUF340 family)
MSILVSLGPLLAALVLGFSLHIKSLSNTSIDGGLKWLTFAMLGMIGYEIGGLENLQVKLYEAGYIAIVISGLLLLFNVGFLTLSGRFLNKPNTTQVEIGKINIPFSWATFSDSIQTVAWVLLGAVIGYLTEGAFHQVGTVVTWMLYLLLFLIGQQLHRANYKLRSLFLNVQGLIICFVTVVSTLLAGLAGAWFLELPLFHGLAVVSGFGWYSLSGIILSDLGYPLLGTTAFLLDIGREVFALMAIPLLSKINSHVSVGYSGATAMDFTLPMLGKFHSAAIIPTAIASGFVMSMLVPIFMPLFISLA